MNPFHVALITWNLAFVAFGIGLFLCIYTHFQPEENENKKWNMIFIDEQTNNLKKNLIYTGDDD